MGNKFGKHQLWHMPWSLGKWQILTNNVWEPQSLPLAIMAGWILPAMMWSCWGWAAAASSQRQVCWSCQAEDWCGIVRGNFWPAIRAIHFGHLSSTLKWNHFMQCLGEAEHWSRASSENRPKHRNGGTPMEGNTLPFCWYDHFGHFFTRFVGKSAISNGKLCKQLVTPTVNQSEIMSPSSWTAAWSHHLASLTTIKYH